MAVRYTKDGGKGIPLETEFIHMTDVEFEKTIYNDGSLAVIADGLWDGEPEKLKVSVNMNMYPHMRDIPENHIWVKNYSECVGLPAALEKAGVAKKVRSEQVDPFGPEFVLMELTIEKII